MKILIVLVLTFFAGCSSSSKLDNSKMFDLNVDNLEMWFDAMPKVQSSSKFYIVLSYSIKNVSGKEIKVNSLNYELSFSNDEKFSFYDATFSPFKLLNSESVKFDKLNFNSEVKKYIPKNDRKSDLYLIINFTIDEKKYSQKIFLKSQEFEIVY